VLALELMLGMASAAWNQAAPGIWINRASAPDGNFPRLSAIATSPAELGANFLTAVYVIPGAAFDLAVSCITMTNAGSLSGSLVASFNTFTFRQTTISDTLRTGLQGKGTLLTCPGSGRPRAGG